MDKCASCCICCVTLVMLQRGFTCKTAEGDFVYRLKAYATVMRAEREQSLSDQNFRNTTPLNKLPRPQHTTDTDRPARLTDRYADPLFTDTETLSSGKEPGGLMYTVRQE